MLVSTLFVLLLLLIVFLLGLGLLVRGWRGMPMLSEPRCAKCDYDLRGFAGRPPTVCTECGSDLARPHAIRWGKHQRRPRLMWAGAAMAGVPLLVIAAISVGAFSRARLGQASRSNAAVISALSTTANQPWDWQELQRRHAAGRLTDAEVAQAVEHLIASLAASPTPGGQPLHWAEAPLRQFDQSGAIADEQYVRLAQAFYGTKPTIHLGPSLRQGSTPRFRVDFGGPWNLPGVEAAKALRAVKTADGRALALAPEYDDRPDAASSDADQFSAAGHGDLAGKLKLDLPPGEHTLTFVLDAGVLKEGTLPEIVQGRPGQARHWPQTRARWTMEVPVKVTVVPPDQSPIELVNDPLLDPQKAGGIKVKRAGVIRTGMGPRLKVELEVGRLTVPISFDVIVKVAGEEIRIGRHVSSGDGRSWTTELAHTFTALPPEVRALDVTLRPNPAHAEELPGIGRIWGGTIELRNVPLQRHDLAAADEPEPSN